ncbi:hypothetical protein [Acidicapsa ligni]|uniref:hypothetical protein n=1 Tax=Acidicapsa ligni TaxID=542300 RepID=UPI0021DF49A2|nr:hypothetical protein [Acidicapsa ligni]
MSDEIKNTNLDDSELNNTGPDELTAKVSLDPAADPVAGKGKFVLLPGLVAIGLYMLVLATVVAFRVVGGTFSPLFLIVAALFVAASFGLLRLFRWAWALTLSAVFLLMSYNLWLFASEKQAPGAVQGLLNLVFFLYLIRVDVRSRLR